MSETIETELNESNIVTNDDTIFSDEDVILPDDTLTQPEEGIKEGESTTPEPNTRPEPYKFKVKFNHEEMELAEPDAIPLIQKGLNYDKLNERLTALQTDPRLSKYDKVQQVSQLLGYQSDDQLLEALYQTYYNAMAEQKGLTPDQVQKEYELQKKEAALREQEEAKRQQQETNAMYERFLQVFPNIKAEDIKPETWAKVQAGMDLTSAYTQQRLEEKENQLKMLEQKLKNKAQAPMSGGVTTHGNQNPVGEDDFLAGFNIDD